MKNTRTGCGHCWSHEWYRMMDQEGGRSGISEDWRINKRYGRGTLCWRNRAWGEHTCYSWWILNNITARHVLGKTLLHIGIELRNVFAYFILRSSSLCYRDAATWLALLYSLIFLFLPTSIPVNVDACQTSSATSSSTIISIVMLVSCLCADKTTHGAHGISGESPFSERAYVFLLLG